VVVAGVAVVSGLGGLGAVVDVCVVWRSSSSQ